MPSEQDLDFAEAMIDSKSEHVNLLRPPKPKESHSKYLEALNRVREIEWRTIRAKKPGLESIHSRPEIAWTKNNFVHAQMMVHERYFFDPVNQKYTVDRYLNDLERRYGGIDSVLIWQNYPNIGVDERNQYDMMRDMPGGYAALREVSEQFLRRGVRMMVTLNPWDEGTRDEGLTAADAVNRMADGVGAYGINGDTMSAPEFKFYEAGVKLGRHFAWQPEAGIGDDVASILWIPMSWGYWRRYGEAPGVDRYKWLDARHRTHVNLREALDHKDELQYAWFNGSGFHSWENVWGIWNGMTPRDSEALRRIATLQRNLPQFFSTSDWIPHFPTAQKGVYASRFGADGMRLWTLVNRTAVAKLGRQFVTNQNGDRFFDLWRGQELQVPRVRGDEIEIEFELEPYGYGAILAIPAGKTPDSNLLARMRELGRRPLADFSSEWKYLPQTLLDAGRTKAHTVTATGMIRVPSANFHFKVGGTEVEKYQGVGVQFPWEDRPQLNHSYRMKISSFLLDQNLVTNSDFEKFLLHTGYSPADRHGFLRDWPKGVMPAGLGRRPVTWISLEEARAYCAWAGKRLPRSWEWQYAAQGTDGRLFPWGDDWRSDAVPPRNTARTLMPPADVDAHPLGASPFGVMDLVGNVWQWTDEFTDAHTRAAVLRGGSSYCPQSSHWYFPQAWRLDQHGKYLLMAPCKDRSGTIGFRCVVDAT